MKRIFLIIILIFGYLTLQSQTVIAKQSFEASGDTWTPLNFSTPPCNNNNDIWDYITNLPGINPNEGSQFWGIRDLNGNCGGNGFETITLPNVDISLFTNVIFSFDYNAIGFDNNEDLKYELFYNGASQGEVIVVNGVGGNSDNTNGWLTETVSIPNGINSVSVVLFARCNAGNERAGFDNVRLQEAPAGGDCAGAETLVVYDSGASTGNETSADTSTTTSSSMSLTSCDSFGSNANLDLFYSFTVPAGETSINVLTAGANGETINIAVWESCNGNEVFCDNTDSGFHVATGLIPGQTYILQVWHDDFNAGAFTIALEIPDPPPTNSDCFDAVELTVGTTNSENLVTGTNEGASSSGELPNPTCANYGGRDVWFTAQVPASGILTVETLSAGSNIDPAMAIYTGNCGNLTQLDCNDDIDWPSNPYSQINITGLPNTTIYIRIYSYNNASTGNFNIVAYSPQCPFTTTWNGSAWNNGAPNSFTSAIINGNYDTASNGNFDSCDCSINSGNTINVRATNYISIENDLTVNGVLEVRHEGSLVMVEDDGIVTSTGTINIHKTTTSYADPLDYTYWSSPTINETFGSALVSSRPDRIFEFDIVSGWVAKSGTDVMTSARGYLAGAPDTGTFPQTQSVIFDGIVHNGIIQTPSFQDINFNWNIIGNPYPSAIDADLFLNDPINTSIITSTIYLWTHNSPISDANPGDERYNYYTGDYATYTAGMGGTAAISGGTIPNGSIASAQGFLAQGLTNGTATFNNSMRITTNNNQFFKSTKTDKAKDRIWLNLSNNEGAFSQLLIGFIENGTHGIDRYDGPKLGGSYISFYSVVEGKEFAVQSKPILKEGEETIKLGLYSFIEENDSLKISIEKIEGALINYTIYLKDKLLNKIHDLTIEDYTFVPEPQSVYDDRFELILTKSQVLDVEEIVSTENKLLALQGDTSVEIKTTNANTINQLKIYDLLGKTILDTTPNNTSYLLNNNSIAKGTILLLSVTLDTNEVLTKKIIIH